MICLNNQEIQTNFGGANYITKVYAGENLVLGQESPYKKATANLLWGNVNNDTIQGNLSPIGTVTIQNNQTIESGGGISMAFLEGSEATISFSGINNITNVEVKMYSGDYNGIHSPQYGTTVSTGTLTDYPENNYLLWQFEGSTGVISFNNPNRDPITKKYSTEIVEFDITVHYLI